MYERSSDAVRNCQQTYPHVAGNLRLLRCMHNMSQEQTAALLHISRSCYGALENGSRTPDIITLCKLSSLYGVSLDHLLKLDMSLHLLSLLKRGSANMAAGSFLSGYLRLSLAARNDLHRKVESLAARDRHGDDRLLPDDGGLRR